MHELPTFSTHTKNTLKLTSLDPELYFLALLLPNLPIDLLVYANVTHPMQSWGREILLWLQTGVLLKTGILLLRHLVGSVFVIVRHLIPASSRYKCLSRRWQNDEIETEA